MVSVATAASATRRAERAGAAARALTREPWRAPRETPLVLEVMATGARAAAPLEARAALAPAPVARQVTKVAETAAIVLTDIWCRGCGRRGAERGLIDGISPRKTGEISISRSER